MLVVGVVLVNERRPAIEIASRGVPAILTSYFYHPPGLSPPSPNIGSRERSDG